MNNFFEIVSDFAKKNKQVAKTLNTLQENELVSREKVPKGNLEDVLTQTLSLPREQEDPWERPYDGLLLTLHRIFNILDKEEDVTSYTDCLSPLCKLKPKDIIFVSFNYDVFLEKALESLFSWSADFGYSADVLAGYVNAEQAEQAQSPNQICDEVYAWSWRTSPNEVFPSASPTQHDHGPIVLKPHGSLNWFIHSKGNGPFWMSNETHGLVLMRPINGRVRISRFWDYPTTNTVKGELADSDFLVGAMLPAIIPPGEKFSKEIPVFQRIEKSIKETLSQVSTLLIIGWSMRQSDKKYRNFFEEVAAMRERELKVMAVCNFHQQKEFYSRFENLLPTKQFLYCNEGFITHQATAFLEKVVKSHST